MFSPAANGVLRFLGSEQMSEILAAENTGDEMETMKRMTSTPSLSSLEELPGNFPVRPEFELYASMTPALDVDGDFYDFFMVDEDHLAMVIADAERGPGREAGGNRPQGGERPGSVYQRRASVRRYYHDVRQVLRSHGIQHGVVNFAPGPVAGAGAPYINAHRQNVPAFVLNLRDHTGVPVSESPDRNQL